MSNAADFVGRGISFPMRVDQSGALAMTSGVDDIDASIRVVLLTAPGERVMRPLFGCRIWELLFEPINANTLGLMADAVREAIGRWEPRVELEDVVLDADPAQQGRVLINLTYRVRVTNDRRNLVYPFYVIPREAVT
jgi:phage baseplate assembly protein W